MFKYIFIVLIFPIFNSCIVDNDFNKEDVEVSFILSDSNGIEKYIFKKDEEFTVTFKIINNSDDEVTFFSSLPIISYSIFQGDSVIARSTDYMDYAAVMINGIIKKEESFVDTWIGPNTNGRKGSEDLIVLSPNQYEIEVWHSSFFKEFKLPKTKTLRFEVIE